MKLSRQRGCLYLNGAGLDDMGHYWSTFVEQSKKQRKCERDGESFHITVVSSEELEKLTCVSVDLVLESDCALHHSIDVYDIGIGNVADSSTEAFYCVCYCPFANSVRKALGLEAKLMHITLGFMPVDVHWKNKGLETISFLAPLEKLLALSRALLASATTLADDCTSESVLKYLVLHFIDISESNSEVFEHLKVIAKSIMRVSLNTDVIVQLGRFILEQGHLLGLRALVEASSLRGEPFDLEMFPISTSIACTNLKKHAQALSRINLLLFRTLGKRSNVVSIERPLNMINLFPLPRNFSFVGVPSGALAGCAKPTKLSQICALYGLGSRAIITLHEEPLNASLVNSAREHYGMECFHFYVEDRTPLSVEQLRSVCEIVSAFHARAECVVIHCEGGVGRTNMAIIAYLMSQQFLSAAEATSLVKSQRKVLMDESQSEALKEWWLHVHAAPKEETSSEVKTAFTSMNVSETPLSNVSLIEKPASLSSGLTLPVVIQNMPPVLVFVGFAASGKSTAANALLRAFPDSFVRINRDEMRGKGECDSKLLEALEMIEGDNRRQRKSSLHVIIDMCNLTVEARKRWLLAAHSPRAWCIFFDIPIEECRYRIQRRKNHPTIPSGSAGLTVLDSMVKQLQPPTSAESFERVIHLSNENEVTALLDDWKVPKCCVDIPDIINSEIPLKFPRTPHALNLGAATRDDKVCSTEDLLIFIGDGSRGKCPGRQVYVEEKIDGANMGIFISHDNKIIAQNRSHFITSSYHAQFLPLDKWLARHTTELWEILEPGRHILYGEWVYATHSVAYSSLPDWFIAYDIFDRLEGKFFSRSEVAKKLSTTSICHVPLVHTGNVDSIESLQNLVYGPSAYGSLKREGIVVRVCDEESLIARSKLVRPDFIAGNERWNRTSTLATNSLRI